MADISQWQNTPNEVDPDGGFEVIPAGDYRVQAVKSDLRATKDGNGQFLEFEFEILDGEYQGKHLWDRLNLVNANTQAREIAERQFSALCHATGAIGVSDSEEIHHRPCIAVVVVSPAKGQYGPSNDIKKYKPIDGGNANKPAGAKPAPSKQESGPSKPWLRNRTAA